MKELDSSLLGSGEEKDPLLFFPGQPSSLPAVEKAVVVHHWDADGISSAAQVTLDLQEKGTEVRNMTPTLGNFFLEKEELDEISAFAPAIVIVVDICIAENRVREMVDCLDAPVWIFDHHKIDPIDYIVHVNPIARKADPAKYPSASHLISRWLGRKDDLLTYLGVAGDWEEKAMKLGPVFNQMEKVLAENGLSFPDLQRLVSLIDASYKIGKKEKVEEAVSVLMQKNVVKAVEFRKDWQEDLFEVDKLIYEAIKKPLQEGPGNVKRLEISSKASIISPVTRKLAKDNPGETVMVVNSGYFDARNQIYVRTTDENVDLSQLIDALRPWAFSVGGKKEVAGIVIEQDEMGKLEKEMERVLK